MGEISLKWGSYLHIQQMSTDILRNFTWTKFLRQKKDDFQDFVNFLNI